MTAKEYFKQARRLDQRINSALKEVESLRELATAVSSTQLTERVQTSRKGEAPYIRILEKIIDMEDKVNKEIDTLVDMKEQIRNLIGSLNNENERMVLRYRYVNNYSWPKIGKELGVDRRTVIRWHERAMEKLSLPENYIKI